MLDSLTRSSIIFQKIMPFVLSQNSGTFCSHNSGTNELQNSMHFNTVYMVIRVTGRCWCRMVRPIIPPAQIWRFCKLTGWMFCHGHPVLQILTPLSTFGMWSVGRSEEEVLEILGIYSNYLEEWNRFAQRTCLRHVASRRRHCQTVVRANGGPIRIYKLQLSMEF